MLQLWSTRPYFYQLRVVSKRKSTKFGKSIVLLNAASILQDRHIRSDQLANLVKPATVYLPSCTALTFNAIIDSGSPFNLMFQLKVKELQLTNGLAQTQKPYGIDKNPI